jgi:hypothetical protein
VNDTEHDATPAVPVAASVHGEVANDPVTPVTANETEPVGVPAPALPVTVAVHDAATPTVVDDGAHATLVVVVFTATVTAFDAVLAASAALPA